MKYGKYILFLGLALSLNACRTAQAPGKNQNANTANAVANSNAETANATPAANASGATPSDALKNLFTATAAGDAPTVQKLLSRETLASLEKSARDQNTTVAEMIKKGEALPITKASANIVTRNEKIDGTKASVEAQAPDLQGVGMDKGEWMPFYFVKEDDVWKLDGKATLQALSNKFREKLEQTGRQIQQAQQELEKQKEAIKRTEKDINQTKQRIEQQK